MAKTPTVRNPEDRFQRETREAISGLQNAPLTSGVLLTGITLTGSTTRVYHNLGRPAVGWVVVDKDDAVDIYRDTAFAASPNLILPLVATGNVTVSLWVF